MLDTGMRMTSMEWTLRKVRSQLYDQTIVSVLLTASATCSYKTDVSMVLDMEDHEAISDFWKGFAIERR